MRSMVSLSPRYHHIGSMWRISVSGLGAPGRHWGNGLFGWRADGLASCGTLHSIFVALER